MMFQKMLWMVLFLGTTSLYAQQKRSLTHEDYDRWKRIQDTQISDDGDVVVATITTATGRGDGYVRIFNARTGESFRFKNGYRTKISKDGKYVFMLRKPPYARTRREKKDDVPEDRRSKDAFFIFDVRTNQMLDSVKRVKRYEIPEEGTGWVVIEKHKDLPRKRDTTATRTTRRDTLAPAQPKKDSVRTRRQRNLALEADYALVYDLRSRTSDSIFRIKNFVVPEAGDRFIYSTTRGGKRRDLGVHSYDVRRKQKQTLDSGRYRYSKLSIDNSGRKLAFLSARDSTEADSLKFQLFYAEENNIRQITDSTGRNLRENWRLSDAQGPYFSKNGKRLFFYSRPRQRFNTDTTLLKEEIPQVDVWSYHDNLIQPEQKSRLKELQNQAFLSFYDTDNEQVVPLHDETLEYVIFDDNREQRYILGYTHTPYEVERSWEYPWIRDYYIIDTRDGSKRLALQGISSSPDLSPDGNFAVYYDQESKSWWSLDLRNNNRTELTEGLQVNFFDEENDVPSLPRPYGFGGFTRDGNILLYDRFDIWSVSPDGRNSSVNITRDGRQNNIQYRTLRLDREHRNNASYYNGQLLISAFSETDKSESLYTLNPGNGRKRPVVETAEFNIGGVQKAEKENTLVFTKQNFQTFPDLHLLRNPGTEPVKLTNANPQQDEYQWGTAELYHWEAYDGTALEGLLYKPENFDPNREYPLMVYFYERRSDNLHNYHMPQPSASTVNMSYLVSNDYLVFVPDIVYTEGKPGESAFNSIVSGVESLEGFDYVDSENMAIQGQSWGGYQVAHLITVTNKFKAAMAGAPVANMTSAYGGIRWESGLSRAFQYERTQSRIGQNLWEGFDLYIENSPLFGIPNIDTPLLMMHNDADGAVPYYQGIEMFMGMRRLNKPVWLLVYNDEAHNLRQMRNRQDLSIRMMQFFDHYLKGAPAPVWMTEGLPAVMKGKDLRYELDERE